MFRIVKPRPEHRAFIEDTFVRAAREGWPWSMVPRADLLYDLQRRIKRPEVRTAVAVLQSDPDEYMAWAAADPSRNEILFAYTIGAYRTDTRAGRKYEPRIATSLVTTLGIDLTRATSLRYWTPTAATLARRGYLLSPTKDTR